MRMCIMREKLFLIIDSANNDTKLGNTYDFIMMAAIIVNIIPLAFKETHAVFQWIDYITVAIFILDYILRLITADFKLKKSAASFFIYPFTPMAVIDLLLNSAFFDGSE